MVREATLLIIQNALSNFIHPLTTSLIATTRSSQYGKMINRAESSRDKPDQRVIGKNKKKHGTRVTLFNSSGDQKRMKQ